MHGLSVITSNPPHYVTLEQPSELEIPNCNVRIMVSYRVVPKESVN